MTKMTKPVLSSCDDNVWTLASAKSRLSEVVDRARSRGPQFITKHGQSTAVVISHDEWQRKTHRVGTLAEFFASSPLRDAPELVIERAPDHAQPPAL
jgi:prevent-host-death family protein